MNFSLWVCKWWVWMWPMYRAQSVYHERSCLWDSALSRVSFASRSLLCLHVPHYPRQLLVATTMLMRISSALISIHCFIYLYALLHALGQKRISSHSLVVHQHKGHVKISDRFTLTGTCNVSGYRWDNCMKDVSQSFMFFHCLAHGLIRWEKHCCILQERAPL